MQTSPKNLQVGWYVFQDGCVYQVTDIDANSGAVTLRDHHTDMVQTSSGAELFTGQGMPCLYASTLSALQNEIIRQQPLAEAFVDGSGLPQTLMDKAKFIIAVVEQIQQRTEARRLEAQRQGRMLKQTAALKAVLADADITIGLTTYYKYLQIYRQYHGNHAQIAAGLRRSSFNQLRMNAVQLHFIDTLLQAVALRPNPLNKMGIYRLAQSIMARTGGHWIDPERYTRPVPESLIADLLNADIAMTNIEANGDHACWLVEIKLPSQRWFYNYIKHIEQQPDGGQALMTARYGKEAWERAYQIYDTFITQAAAPLQFVFADHWQMDVLVLDEEEQPVRLWLTLLLDAYSRSVLGMALLSETPCIESIQQALLHAIWPKQSHQQWGLSGTWPCYGIPQHLSLDNAWAHHSHSMEDLARSLSMSGQYNAMTLAFRPPYRGRYGAIIERIFGNFSDQVRQFLPGAIQPDRRQAYAQAVKTARLRYDDLNRFLHEIILHYQHTPHIGLGGMTPHEKWQEGLQLGLPLVPHLKPDVERLFWRMAPRSRTLTSKGIAAFGLHYTAAALNGAPRTDLQGQTIRYTIRYSPMDISRLAVFRDGQWVAEVYAKELRLADGTTQRLSVAEREMARQLARSMDHPARDWLQFTQVWQQMQGRVEMSNAEPVPPADMPDYATHYTELLSRFNREGGDA